METKKDIPMENKCDAILPGYLKCFISGKPRKDTPEEKVRQDVARSFIEEYGYSKLDIEIEFPIKMGREKKRIDIALFKKNDAHIQENIFIIVEVKSEDVKPSDKKDGIEQLKSYVAACINVEFALWVASERLPFRIIQEKRGKKILDVPDIPKEGETSIPRPVRGSLVPAVNLKQVFKRIHNYIYVNQGFQKDKAFEELLKLIFIKVYDEQYNPTLQFYVLPDEDISKLRKRLADVFKKVQERYKYIFKGNDTLELNDAVLLYLVAELQRFSFVDTSTDVKGEAYEAIVGPNLRGDRGEFFTPRNVCDMLIEMLFYLYSEEKLTSPGAMKIIDPATGTGGFLIAGIQKLKNIFLKRKLKYDQLRDSIREVANINFNGIDFNPFLVKVSQMNMVMHGDGSSNISHANSLENPINWNDEAKKKIRFGEFDVVVTNPPFGTKAVIDSTEVLSQYELTMAGTNSSRNAIPPEQLFIERCLDFLKPHGYLGIVLPDSILGNPGLIWLREWILKKTYIIASIDLPVETFEPHTGTQTSVLILKKKKKEEEKLQNDYEIFMAIPDKVGHDRRGNAVFQTTPDGEIKLDSEGRPLIDDDLASVSNIFKNWIKSKGVI